MPDLSDDSRSRKNSKKSKLFYFAVSEFDKINHNLIYCSKLPILFISYL